MSAPHASEVAVKYFLLGLISAYIGAILGRKR